MNFRGERRSNDTHASTTDPDARLAKIKGKEAKLSYRGHILVENRNGLIADCELTQATGTAEPRPPPPCSGGNAPGGEKAR